MFSLTQKLVTKQLELLATKCYAIDTNNLKFDFASKILFSNIRGKKRYETIAAVWFASMQSQSFFDIYKSIGHFGGMVENKIGSNICQII